MGSGLEELDFSHEGVKRVVGLLIGFVSVIASAPYRFLYLNQRIHDYKNKKKRSLPRSYLPTYETSTFVLTLRPHFRRLEIYEHQTPSKWVSIDPPFCCPGYQIQGSPMDQWRHGE